MKQIKSCQIIKYKIYMIILLCFSVFSSIGYAFYSKEQKKGEILLDYNFKDHYPTMFKVVKSGDIFLGDGHYIYMFNNLGKILKRFVVPGTAYNGLRFYSLDIDNSNEALCYLGIDKNVVCFNIRDGKKQFEIKNYGNNFKRDDLGAYYTLYQIYDRRNDSIKNKIRIVDKHGLSVDYKTKIDLAADNLEIINAKIISYIIDKKIVCVFPILGKDGINVNFKVNMPSDRSVKIIGFLNKKYVFQYTDYKAKIDSIVAFDINFKIMEKGAIKLNFNDISNGFKEQDNGELLTDFPTGNIYSFGNDRIYLMRNMKTGTHIFNLSSLVNI